MSNINLSSRNSGKKISLLQVILLSGLLVGSLDILSAIVDYYIATEKGPAGIFRFIASGVVGKSAYSGGNEILLLGVALHFLIAMLFTFFFFFIYPLVPLLARNRVITGIIYGLFIWAVMNRIVVPLSHVPALTFHWKKAIKAALILIFMIGLPLSFIAYRFFNGRKMNTGK